MNRGVGVVRDRDDKVCEWEGLCEAIGTPSMLRLILRDTDL